MSRWTRHSPRGLLPLLIAAASGCGENETSALVLPEGLEYASVQEHGFAYPKDIVYDGEADVYLVSNEGTGAREEGHRGFISRISPAGKVVDLRWIDHQSGAGVEAPRGMTLVDDTLYVADGECVRRFHRESGDPLNAFCPPGANKLLGVAVDRRGQVYASDVDDAGGHSIFVLSIAGELLRVMGGEAVGQVRGVAVGPRGVFAVARDAGSLYQVTPRGPRGVVRSDGWQLEDLVFTDGGSIALSDPGSARILFFRARDGGARGSMYTLVDSLSSPGGLGYDHRRGRILITQSPDRLAFIQFTDRSVEHGRDRR